MIPLIDHEVTMNLNAAEAVEVNIRQKTSVIHRRIATAVLSILFCILFVIISNANATLLEGVVEERIDQEGFGKFSYVLSLIIDNIDIEDTSYLDFGGAHIIRIESPDYCIGSACLGFVILDCDFAVCPYATAMMTANFLSQPVYNRSNAASGVIMLLFGVPSKQEEDGNGAVFVIGEGFITVHYAHVKNQN